MANKYYLITGGAGFIGSNFVPYFLKENPEVNVVNLDKLTYAGNLENLKDVENNERYFFVEGDICDEELVDNLFSKYGFKGVIHFAAESHVDNSISNPNAFIKTNVNGTFTLLEAARKHWLTHHETGCHSQNRFLHISTDEVYGSLGETGHFTEESPYRPNSPYSASKAASDFLVRSYFHTYGLNVVISNCSNNYGPKQHKEKLIPTIIRKALKEEPIPIYGDGKNVRDWLFVRDHCTALNTIFYKGKSGETYVIGGDNERNNIQISETICTLLDQIKPRQKGTYAELITFVSDRPGHDFRYAIDAKKLKNELGWTPEASFDAGIKQTVTWYLEN